MDQRVVAGERHHQRMRWHTTEPIAGVDTLALGGPAGSFRAGPCAHLWVLPAWNWLPPEGTSPRRDLGLVGAGMGIGCRSSIATRMHG
jgi:hypothetical protein